jgi:ABC-type cobalamin/Fe3+-siderophores transport system ATPase subunit
MSALQLNGVSFRYHQEPVLHELNWSVAEGSVSGIIGPNGSGKTTIFKILTGLLEAKQGQVKIGNSDIQTLHADEIARQVALVPQMEQMVFPYPVKMMVSFGRYPHQKGPGYMQRDDDETVEWAMDLCGVTTLAERSVTELSGGELHRVLFARALAQDTPILLLDEPTAFMDIKYQVALFDLLLRMREEYGKTVVCVTHDLNIAASYFDEVAILNHGSVQEQGPPMEVLTEQGLGQNFDIDVTVHTLGKETPPFIQIHSVYSSPGSKDSGESDTNSLTA